MSTQNCGLCGKPAVGNTRINGTPYCHTEAGSRPSCYDKARLMLPVRQMCAGCGGHELDEHGRCTAWGDLCEKANRAVRGEQWVDDLIAAASVAAERAWIDDGVAQLAWWANNSTSEAC